VLPIFYPEFARISRQIGNTLNPPQLPSGRHPPFADNDNEEWLSSFKAAKILGVTPPTLRNWLYYGRPVVGLRRKKRKELNAKMIGGHLKFEAASVHALAKKISRSI
jgi:hypothetical protein